jgi:hypothetical protein
LSETDDYSTPFTSYLEANFDLQSLSIWCPEHFSQSGIFYCDQPPKTGRKMLSDGKIDVLRFIYDKPLGPTPSHESTCLREATGTVHRETIYPFRRSVDTEIKQIPRQFDAVIEQLPYEWACFGIKAVIKVTRWTDTRLGSPTIETVVRK